MKNAARNAKIIATILVTAILCQVTSASEDEDWLKKHAIIKTAEIEDHDDDGNVTSSRTVKTTQINILQTSTETRKRNNTADLVLTERVAETVDTFGGKVQVVESLLPGSLNLITTAITTVQVITGGSITTVQNRGANGIMRIASRITTVTNPNGTITTVIEVLDKHGRLIPKQTTTQK
jgi:hypothetical protein